MSDSSSSDEYESNPHVHEDESTDEDDDAILLDQNVEAEVLTTIAAIRRRDPSLKDPSKSFFSTVNEQEIEQKLLSRKQTAKPKPSITVKDYELSSLADLPDEEDLEAQQRAEDDSKYSKEKSFLSSMANHDSDDDDLLIKKERKTNPTSSTSSSLQPLVEVLADDDETDRFLKDYILQEKWKGGAVGDDVITDDVDLDKEHVAKENDFEEDFNFRFEDEALAFPRIIEDSLRQTKSKRKRQREAKKERELQKTTALEYETKKKKTEKKREILGRLEAIEAELGITFTPPTQNSINLDLIEEDFDPDKFDQYIENHFDEITEGVQFDDLESEVRFRLNHLRTAGKSTNQAFDEEEFLKAEAFIERKLEEYYGLDFEDVAGDSLCRFKYKTVEPEDFGLDVLDILTTDDAELNRRVGLKMLAPYRETPPKKQPRTSSTSSSRLALGPSRHRRSSGRR
ncbi:hypothetical protein RCL1_008756 [Eukaryota sp. TZLM3-RCL]